MNPASTDTLEKAMYVAAVVAMVGVVRHVFPKLDGRVQVTLAALLAGALVGVAQMYLPPRVWTGMLGALAAVGGMTALDRFGAAVSSVTNTTSSSTTVNVAKEPS